MHVAGSSSPLTVAEIERSKKARAENLFAEVKPSDVCGPNSSGFLAQQVRREFPTKYKELAQEWRYLSHEEKRPAPEVKKASADDLLLDF